MGKDRLNKKSKITHMIFDRIRGDIGVQPIGPQEDNKLLLSDIETRLEQITPSESEIKALEIFVGKILEILRKLPELKHVDDVGSFAMNTMRKGRVVADIAMEFCKTPRKEDFLKIILEHLTEELNKEPTFSPVDFCEDVRSGIRLTSADGSTAIVYPAVKRSDDIEGCVDLKNLESNMVMLCQKKGYVSYGVQESAKQLMRLIADTRDRYPGFSALNPWLICLLGIYCNLDAVDRWALPLHVAYKRFLQLLAAGFFFSTSKGLIDETQVEKPRAHLVLTESEQDEICCTAQTLLRLYCHGLHRTVIGLDEPEFDINDDIVINNIILKPSMPIY